MDVLILLKAGEQLEDMKTFVKALINIADIGRCDPVPKYIFYVMPAVI